MNLFIIRSTIILSIFISISTASSTEIIFNSSFGYNSNPTLDSSSAIERADNKNEIISRFNNVNGRKAGNIQNPLISYKPDDEPEGSFFSTHTLSLANEFFIADKFSIGILPSVTYQNFFEISDNHQLNFDLYLSPIASNKRFTPYIFTTASFYRDSMLKLDSRDEFTFGAGGEIMLSGRYTLAFEHAWQRIDYLEKSPIFAATGREIEFELSGGFQEPLDKLLSDLEKEYSRIRDDVNMMLKMRFDIFMLPSLTTSIGLKYDYLISSLDAESFWQLTPDVKVIWDFAAKWQLAASAQLERKELFKIDEVLSKSNNLPLISLININNGVDRESILDINSVNYTYSLNLRVSYFLSNINFSNKFNRIENQLSKSSELYNQIKELSHDIELFAEILTEHGQYPINSESYKQQVLQCGFSWSF